MRLHSYFQYGLRMLSSTPFQGWVASNDVLIFLEYQGYSPSITRYDFNTPEPRPMQSCRRLVHSTEITSFRRMSCTYCFESSPLCQTNNTNKKNFFCQAYSLNFSVTIYRKCLHIRQHASTPRNILTKCSRGSSSFQDIRWSIDRHSCLRLQRKTLRRAFEGNTALLKHNH